MVAYIMQKLTTLLYLMFSSVLHSISNLRFAGMSVLIKVAIPPPLSVRSLPQGLAVIFSHHQVCIKKKLRAPVVPPQGLVTIQVNILSMYKHMH